MPECGVVILNWNGAHLLKDFLPVLLQHTDPQLADIIVADNASEDDSPDMLAQQFPSVFLVRLEKNYGFAEGYNRALEQLDYRYYVLLNSDVEVTAGWLEPLHRLLAGDERIGAVMPKIRSWHQRDYFEHAGAAGGFLDRYGYPFCRGRIFNVLEKDTGQYDVTDEIFWASGACLMVRADVYHLAGGLDNYFFAHMEEIDLCWRLQNLDYRIFFCHESVVFHIGGATLSKYDTKKTYLNFRNNFILLYKNLPVKGLRRLLAMRVLLDWVSALFFLLKFEFGESMAVVRAQINVLVHLRHIRQKRKEAGKVVRSYKSTLLFPRSIVFQFFIRRKKLFSNLS